MSGEQSASKQIRPNGRFLLLLIALGGALAVLCHQAFLPHQVSWANDVPLGAMLDPSARLPGTLAGHWSNLEWVGGTVPSSSPSFSTILQMILPPEIYLKIFVPACMFFLGFGAWLFFRQSGFAPGVCVVGAIGAGLNMHYFSNATWGLGTWAVAAGMVLISLAIIVSPSIRPAWVKAALAGLAVGLVVMEAFDAGAILSLYVGAFIVFYYLTTAPDPVKGMARTIGMGSVVVLFALLISSSTLYTLVGTQIKGIANTGQSPEEKEAHWEFITTASFPKLETLRLVIPGLFGYRLQDYATGTNKSNVYWGSISESPVIYQLESGNSQERARAAAALGQPPDIQNAMAGDNVTDRQKIVDQIKAGGGFFRRHTGSGDYIGVLVVLMAIFSLFNSWRSDSPYAKSERQIIWFWALAAAISLLAAWGRYSWLYQFIYRLPFINNIRNPIKFLHALDVCVIILSGYGLEALHRRYLSVTVSRVGNFSQQIVRWWQKAGSFDKKWTVGTLLVWGASLIGLLVYASSKTALVKYLENNGFVAGSETDPSQIAAYSIHEVFLFVVFFTACTVVVLGILSGLWTGRRAVWAWVLLGAIMILDLGHADAPWIRYYDYTQVYSSNPVLDFLKQNPWEHRVTSRFLPTGGNIPGNNNLAVLAHWWLENDYLADKIEALEVDQWPREPDMDKNFIGAFSPKGNQDLASPIRLWRLTNTKYILADARATPALNQLGDPKDSFRDVMRMNIVLKPGVKQYQDAGDLTIQPDTNGSVALIDFTAALPRAKLYSNWQMADDETTLAKLNSSEFDPAKTVLISTNTPVPEKPIHSDSDPGTVTITAYEPKDVKLQADAKAPAVLLFNDRTGEYWHVRVDDKPASLLRCNYLMRGVFVPEGHHTIEFYFEVPLTWLHVSVAAFILGILLTGYVVFTGRRQNMG